MASYIRRFLDFIAVYPMLDDRRQTHATGTANARNVGNANAANANVTQRSNTSRANVQRTISNVQRTNASANAAQRKPQTAFIAENVANIRKQNVRNASTGPQQFPNVKKQNTPNVSRASIASYQDYGTRRRNAPTSTYNGR